jgi:hypothetical protein
MLIFIDIHSVLLSMNKGTGKAEELYASNKWVHALSHPLDQYLGERPFTVLAQEKGAAQLGNIVNRVTDKAISQNVRLLG